VRSWLPLLLALAACPPPPLPEDTGSAGEETDTDDSDGGDTDDSDGGDTDTGDTDVGDTDPGDTDVGDTDPGDTDVEPPVALYGPGPWDCTAVPAAVLSEPGPALLRLAVTLDGEPGRDALSEGGRRLRDAGTLGGSSIQSEILAYEVLHRCDGATLLETEGEIPYEDDGGKKTDLVIDQGGARYGVSVARAVGFPPEDPYPVSRARDLLDDKLADVLLSSENVVDSSAWVRQLLVIPAYAARHADSLEAAWADVDATTRGDTLVVVVVTDGDDTFVYFDG
jgi:hypothetical protein